VGGTFREKKPQTKDRKFLYATSFNRSKKRTKETRARNGISHKGANLMWGQSQNVTLRRSSKQLRTLRAETCGSERIKKWISRSGARETKLMTEENAGNPGYTIEFETKPERKQPFDTAR